MQVTQGCAFLEQVRQRSFESEVAVSLTAGLLLQQGVAVHRARVSVPPAHLRSAEHAAPERVVERAVEWVRSTGVFHVVVVRDHYPDLARAIGRLLPDRAVIAVGEGELPGADVIRRWMETGGRPLPVTHSQLTSWDDDIVALVQRGEARFVLSRDDLTPEVTALGFDGDLFLDHHCYYRAPYKEGVHAALEGTSSCSFCDIAQPERRTAVPVPERLASQIEAYARQRPSARTFHLIDANALSHIDAIADVVVSAARKPLEICVDLRVSDFLRHRERLERALQILAPHRHVLNAYCTGFETFSPAAWSRLNKGYPIVDNVACLLLFDELSKKYPGTFDYQRFSGHGFINLTPWSTPDELLVNAYFARALDFSRACTGWYLRKLRIYDSLPIARMAEKDGVFIEAYEDWRHDNAHWKGYRKERPWRFLDPHAALAARWILRMFMPESSQERERAARLRALMHPRSRDAWAEYVVGAIVQACEESADTDGDDAVFERIERWAARSMDEILPAQRVLRAFCGGSLDIPAALEGAVSGGDMAASPEDMRAAGRARGYPPCCVEAYVTRARQAESDFQMLALAAVATEGPAHRDLDPWSPWRVIEHIPCRFDCPASIEHAERARAFDSGCRPEEAHGAPQLVLGAKARVALLGGAPTDDGWTYREVRAYGSGPRLDVLAAALASGDRVSVRPSLVLVWRGPKLLHALPENAILPWAPGEPSRFPWLAELATKAPEAVAPKDPPLMRLVVPESPGALTLERFQRMCKSAAHAVDSVVDATGWGFALLFDDGEYAFFRGQVDDIRGQTRIRIDKLLRHVLPSSSPRTQLYCKLRSGSVWYFDAAGRGMGPLSGFRLGFECDVVMVEATPHSS